MLSTDLKQAFRWLRKSPGFTLVAVATLGAGIGLNTAIFSVVHGVLLAPLSFPDEQRIVSISTRSLETGRETPRMTGGDLEDVRKQAGSFEALSRYYGGEMGVQVGGRAEFTGVSFVEEGFYRVFGTAPVVGHAPSEGQVAVSESFALRNFGRAGDALGRTVSVEGKSYEIAAVMPFTYQFPRKSNLWLTMPSRPENLNRTAYNYRVAAKLKPDVSVDQARADLGAIGSRLASAYPENRKKTFTTAPMRDQLVGPVRTMLLVLMGAVALVLLIACANVANLLLARATTRVREMAVRAALGAGRGRIIRQLLTESLVLGLLGGLAGCALAYLGTDAMLRLAPENLPRLNEVRVDTTTLVFATLISMFSAVLFSLAPAWQASRVDLNEALKQSGGRGVGNRGSHRLRGALASAEIALAFVLALGAGLLMKSFLGLTTADLGFRPDGVLVIYAHVPANEESEYKRATGTFEKILRDVSVLPGVKSASAAMGMPAGQYGSNGSYAVEGKHVFAPGAKLPEAGFRLASPGYFATLGIPLLRGRDFSERDQYSAPVVAIISQALARETFPNEDPLGKRIKCGLDRDEWMTVIGVVGDIRSESPAAKLAPEIYMAFQQHPYFANELQVAIRTSIAPASLTEAVRSTVARTNPGIAMKFTTLQEMVSESISAPRFRTFLVGIFAALALLLAMAGIHGVMSYAVAQRTPELGLRMALGAPVSSVAGLVLGKALLLAGAGIAVGLALSLASGKVMQSLLVGVKPADAFTYAAAVVGVILAVLTATAVPVWRATRIDPVVALRDE